MKTAIAGTQPRAGECRVLKRAQRPCRALRRRLPVTPRRSALGASPQLEMLRDPMLPVNVLHRAAAGRWSFTRIEIPAGRREDLMNRAGGKPFNRVIGVRKYGRTLQISTDEVS